MAIILALFNLLAIFTLTVKQKNISRLIRINAFAFALCCMIVVIIVHACNPHPYSSSRNRDYSTYYTTDKTRAMPSYVVYNLNDSVSRLYFSVKSTDLLYSRSNVNNQLTAHILVDYILHPVDQPRTISDSGHVVINDVNEDGTLKLLSGYTDFDVPGDGDYFVDVTMRDLNKMSVTYELIRLNHNGPDAWNNFLLTENNSETPLFRNYVKKEEQFSLRHNNPLTNRLYCAYFKNVNGPARPPYAMPSAETEILPDSSWSIDVVAGTAINLPKEGYYRFTTTAGGKGGFTICRFADGYPKVTTPVSLLEPLRYITTKNEYSTLETSRNLKASIDSFWITTGGSQDRARELISAYYGRVEIANIHFSNFKEGWKTDRGMVYIIYGEPQNVYRFANSETWVYGQDQGGNMLNFVFNRNTVSGVQNDFILERNQVYNISWITAVDYWKQGQVYRAK